MPLAHHGVCPRFIKKIESGGYSGSKLKRSFSTQSANSGHLAAYARERELRLAGQCQLVDGRLGSHVQAFP
jgi:hypothetical protein